MRPIKKGSTDQSVVIRILSTTSDPVGQPVENVEHNTSGIALWYRREGSTKATITPASLAALDTAHSDGGIEHIDDGYYRLDLPDAAFATGANGVMVGGTVTDMVVIGTYVPLVDYDPQDAVRLGLTALPNAAADAAGGLPISDAGGLDLDAKLANTNEITVARMGALTDWIDGGRLDLLLDDIPNTSEFEARTLLANGYFDFSTDEVIVGSLSTAAKAEVNAEVDGSIETYHLDHLLAATYDPASKPGAADALLNELVESDAGVSRFTANALEQAPTGGSAPTAGEVADAVWTEILADHSGVSGSTAEALGAAGSAGDPWTTALPGAYTSGQAGKIIGDNVNATISSRSSHSAADVWAVATRLLTAGTNIVLAKGTGVTGFNDLSAAQVNAEVDQGLTDYGGPTNAQMEARTLLSASYGTSANQTTILARLGVWTGTGVNTILGAFRALLSKTASNPSDIGGTFDAATDSNEAITDRGNVAWVTATGFSTHSAADVWAVGTRVLTAGTNLAIPTATENADAYLARGVSNVENTADRHSVAAMVMIQTNASVNVAGDTLTAKKPSDDTTFQTYTLTASPGADPITGIS